MARETSGSAFNSRGKWFAKVSLPGERRPSLSLPSCATREEALARIAIITKHVDALRAAGRVEYVEEIAKATGKALDHVELDDVAETVRGLVDDVLVVPRDAPELVVTKDETIETLANRWTSGQLAKLYPDHIKLKSSSDDDAGRFAKHVFKVVGNVRVRDFTLTDYKRLLRALDPALSKATRRHVAQAVNRLLTMAVFPLELIKANPLPKNAMPSLGKPKAKGWLYPVEEAKLSSCEKIPIEHRLFCGARLR